MPAVARRQRSSPPADIVQELEHDPHVLSLRSPLRRPAFGPPQRFGRPNRSPRHRSACAARNSFCRGVRAVAVDRVGDRLRRSFGERDVEPLGAVVNVASSGSLHEASPRLVGRVATVQHPGDPQMIEATDAVREHARGACRGPSPGERSRSELLDSDHLAASVVGIRIIAGWVSRGRSCFGEGRTTATLARCRPRSQRRSVPCARGHCGLTSGTPDARLEPVPGKTGLAVAAPPDRRAAQCRPIPPRRGVDRGPKVTACPITQKTGAR